MDERKAWQNFYTTGKIEDYIRYSQLKNQTDLKGFSSLQGKWESQGGYGLSEMRPPSVTEEGTGENTNTGADHPGADHRGK